MRYLSHASEGRRETKIPVGSHLALAHYLVSRLEGLPGVSGDSGTGLNPWKLSRKYFIKPPFGEVFDFTWFSSVPRLIWGDFGGPNIAQCCWAARKRLEQPPVIHTFS
jgi:hypothetical protein